MPSPQRGRPREFDTDQAIDAAMMLFWEQGYEAVGVAQLCEAMGIAKQSMYDWAGGKRGLYLLALDMYFKSKICGLEINLKQEASPIANLRHCLHAMAEYAKTPSNWGCFLTNAQSEFGTTDAEVQSLTASVEEYITDQFREVLERAKAAGEVADDLDCQATASALSVFRNGIMLAGRSGQSTASIDQSIAAMEAMIRPT